MRVQRVGYSGIFMEKEKQEQNKICSVILPVYNSERYLNRTVTSVLQQTMGDFELLAIDDFLDFSIGYSIHSCS